MTETAYRFGSLLATFEGEHEIATLIREEMGTFEENISKTPDVRISIADELPDLGEPEVRLTGSRMFLKHSVEVYADGQIQLTLKAKPAAPLYEVHISKHPYTSEPIEVTIVPGFQRRTTDILSRPFARAATRDYSSFHELIAKNVIYEVLDPILWCKLLVNGETFVHAGCAVNQDGIGTLFMGSGGVGKSTTTLALVEQFGWNYLSDDLAILSRDGVVRRYPKKLQVYAYNANLVPEVEEPLLEGRSVIDRTMWSIRRKTMSPKQLRRRITASKLFGEDHVSDEAKLNKAFLITASPNSSKVEVKPMKAEVVANMCATTLLEEFWDFIRFLNAAAAIHSDFPSLPDLHAAARDVFADALGRADCSELCVPPRTPGNDIAKTITDA